MKNLTVIGLTPFESPDIRLIPKFHKAGAFPVLSLGYDPIIAQQALSQLEEVDISSYGIYFPSNGLMSLDLPDKVSLVILPFGISMPAISGRTIIYQVSTLQDAKKALEVGADGIIVKGNEAAGKVGYESTFVLFQRLIKEIKDIPVWLQGGIGLHTAAAACALGALGVVLDSQLALFPECTLPSEFKSLCSKLNGTETKIIANHRVLVRPDSPLLSEEAKADELISHFTSLDPTKAYIPMGQDIALAVDLYENFRSLKNLVFGFQEAMYGHLKQAKALDVIDQNNPLARQLEIRYPIAQGPMTRVSDVPLFANSVAEAGGLPFVALSLLKGKSAKELVTEAKVLMGDKTWG
ncbi:erythronolide synthase, partial [Sphingobacterium shayense]|nr:erythronolide synthase [Sphingobacterium shayense]